MRSDEKDFVFQGTSIEREEEIASQKKKSVAGASSYLKTLLAWKQEVTDEEGRSRFHGAFTGEYSVEYYNTVGSKEGWAPQSFTSSRKNGAGARKQSISDFLDEDERVTLLEERLANVGANHSLVALDCGSGIGRITKNLMIRYFNEVHWASDGR